MKPFAISESHLTQYLTGFSFSNKVADIDELRTGGDSKHWRLTFLGEIFFNLGSLRRILMG